MTELKRLRIKAAEAQGWTGPWRFGSTHLHGTPPSGRRKVAEGDHVPEAIDRLVVEMGRRIERLTQGIEEVRELINDSHGVDGYHKNGDTCPWEDLETGGRYEFLILFNIAEEAVAEWRKP